MSEAIIVAIITGLLTLTGTALTVRAGTKKNEQQLRVQLATIEEKIAQFEKRIDKHNNVIERTYKLEERQAVAEHEIKVANHRIEDLEKKGKAG